MPVPVEKVNSFSSSLYSNLQQMVLYRQIKSIGKIRDADIYSQLGTGVGSYLATWVRLFHSDYIF